MSDEREYITGYEFAQWLVPSIVVVIGAVAFFFYISAALAIGVGASIP